MDLASSLYRDPSLGEERQSRSPPSDAPPAASGSWSLAASPGAWARAAPTRTFFALLARSRASMRLAAGRVAPGRAVKGPGLLAPLFVSSGSRREEPHLNAKWVVFLVILYCTGRQGFSGCLLAICSRHWASVACDRKLSSANGVLSHVYGLILAAVSAGPTGSPPAAVGKRWCLLNPLR